MLAHVITFSLLSACIAAPDFLNRTLEDRIDTGECSAEQVAEKGSFFPEINRTSKDDGHADFFDIVYAPTFKVVSSKLVEEQYVLTQCGQQPPTDDEVDAVARLGKYTRKHFSIPLQSFMADQTVHYGFLDELDVDDRVGHVITFVTEPCWQKALACQRGVSATSAFDFDAIFTSNLGSVGDSERNVYVPAAQDPAPLNSAEYIKFFGAFFNKDAESSRLFEGVKNAYQAADSGYPQGPVVAWIGYEAYWNKFVLYAASYKLHFVTAAGGDVFNASLLDGLPGLEVTEGVSGRDYRIDVSKYADKATAAAQFMNALESVDVVVDETYASKPSEYDFDSFLGTFHLSSDSAYKFVQNRMVLRIDGTVGASTLGLDWYESRVARPDWAANGLARCLHHDNTKTWRYFRNIAEGELPKRLTASMCTEKLPICGEGAPQSIDLLGDGTAPPTPKPTPTPAPTPIGKGNFGALSVFVAVLSVVAILGCVLVRARSQSTDGDLSTELAA